MRTFNRLIANKKKFSFIFIYTLFDLTTHKKKWKKKICRWYMLEYQNLIWTKFDLVWPWCSNVYPTYFFPYVHICLCAIYFLVRSDILHMDLKSTLCAASALSKPSTEWILCVIIIYFEQRLLMNRKRYVTIAISFKKGHNFPNIKTTVISALKRI